MRDKFKAHACDFKSREACEEELESEGIDIEEAERLHYEEE